MTNVTSIGNANLELLLGKARHAAAADSPRGMWKGEALAVALVLKRPDWLAALGATLAEAIEQIRPTWCRLVTVAARQFERDAQNVSPSGRDHPDDLKTTPARPARPARVNCRTPPKTTIASVSPAPGNVRSSTSGSCVCR
jgi:hypothetical protein